MHLPVRRAAVGEDPVDEVEPVARAAASGALDSVDRLHELAAEARLDVVPRLEQPHDALVLVHGVDLLRGDLLVAEVLRHAHVGAALLRLALAEATAPDAEGDGQRERGDAGHSTRTLSANERTKPSFSAYSRCAPGRA